MCYWQFCIVMILTIADGRADGWLTGRDFEKAARGNAVSANWTQAPLGPQLAAFSRAQRIGIILDRRIDPSQLVDLRASNLTLEQFLWRLAEIHELGVCQIGDMFYLGPPDVAACLPGLVENIWTQLGTSNQARLWRANITLKVVQPFEPMQEIRRICTSAKLEVGNLNETPMDLWAPIDWPEMPTGQAICLLVIGFGLWPETDNGQIRLEELQIPQTTKRQFAVPANLKPADLLKEFRKQFPQVKFEITNSKLSATGDLDPMTRVARLAAEQFRPTAQKGVKTFTLKTNASRGSILATIAQQTGLELEAPPELRSILEQRVQLDVNQVSLDELVSAALEETKIEFSVENSKLILRAKSDQ